MSLRIGALRQAIVVAPHPDDEVIGAAALIQALKGRGTRVKVVIVSDGAASHPASPTWPARRLVAARRRESLMALRRLAVPSTDVRFLGLPDGALLQQADRCRRALRRAVRMVPHVDLIVGPAIADAHPDHRAVAIALSGGIGRARRLTYLVWPARAARRGTRRSLVMRGGHAAKRSLIRLHHTQIGAITDDPNGFSIASHELIAFSHAVEGFTEVLR